jgi:16S rRNA processing protein RimM
MDKKDCFYLGYTVKQIGYKGEINIQLDVDNPESYSNLGSVFIEINEQLIPFFIEKVQIRDKGQAVIKIEGVDTPIQAEELLGNSLYLPLNMLPPLTGNNFYFHEVEGFTVIDDVHGDIGIVKQVLEFPRQAVLQVLKGEKEILIPISDEFILDVNRSEKIIRTATPEGLVEMYLS